MRFNMDSWYAPQTQRSTPYLDEAEALAAYQDGYSIIRRLRPAGDSFLGVVCSAISQFNYERPHRASVRYRRHLALSGETGSNSLWARFQREEAHQLSPRFEAGMWDAFREVLR